ncbi:hypothetical protein [Streptomyces sp. NBC_00459]|uniref:hypothetical protein n=1 Tax=Streptomyces sp. NBC_00459 TaxID=2975749 RepID=UPI002E17D956
MSDVEDAPACGAAKTFPDTPEAQADGWAGVTVECVEGPHQDADEAVHSGPVVVDGEARAVYFWGPGWRPMGDG